MRRGQALGGARRSESGETLVELMITIAIMGVSIVAILGAIWTSIRISDYHRKTTDADVVLRNYAEVIKSNSAAVPVGAASYDASYRPCEVLGTSGTYPTYTPPAPNASYVATVESIQYLNGYDSTTNAPTWRAQSSGCPAGGDQGLQQLTLKVTGPTSDPAVHGTETVTILKRNAVGEA
jgi:type II secretory pathway pseudopilin PulG